MKKKLMALILIVAFVLTGTVSMTAEATSGSWRKDSKGWWYRYSDGSYAKSTWIQIGKVWYHFDSSGYMQTGWQKIGKWYYFNTSGAMQTGWKKIKGVWY